MLWIGERTRRPDGAHVEFFSGVHNPLGVKVGPTATRRRARRRCCERLNPDRVPGQADADRADGRGRGSRSSCRRCCASCATRGTRSSGRATRCTRTYSRPSAGVKTRRFDDVLGELEGFFAACREDGAWPGGVHLEFTGEDVTECLGGAEAVLEEQLSHRYETLCDPRLNARQSLDLAFRLAELLQDGGRPPVSPA